MNFKGCVMESMQATRIAVLIVWLSPLGMGISQAGEMESLKQEVEGLKGRVEQIEKKDGETTDGEGHKLHPVQSAFGAKLSGGATAIYQKSVGTPSAFGGNGAEGQMSADLFLESPIGNKGSFLLRLDIEQGVGLSNLPPLFTNPDGNLTGPNNDVETFNNPESLNVNEVRYEHRLLRDFLKITMGQIDLTSYFDENNYANKETFQYIAQHFNNNIAIDWGGSVNFFGPGVVLTAYPSNAWIVTLGWFEGNGDYTSFFNDPFLMGELTFKVQGAGRVGNYRAYAWERQTPHCQSASAPGVFFNCALISPAADQVQIKSRNSGFGLSLDQQLSSAVGIWARAGYQDPDVAQFDKTFSAGVVTSAARIGRPDDVVGLAYGLVAPSGAYKSATGFSDKEHYAEIYYKFVVSGDGSTKGFHVTPDVQYVANPAGNGAVDPAVVYGLRTQVHF
ncbi:MAG: carbohydrate porin [Nitrospirae bacterium]|nr:carbohydrate porin [Nitrospirota bacterium]